MNQDTATRPVDIPTKIIGIFGPSCSGKTSLCKHLLQDICNVNPRAIIFAFTYDNERCAYKDQLKERICTGLFQFGIDGINEHLDRITMRQRVLSANNKLTADTWIVFDEVNNPRRIHEFMLESKHLGMNVIVIEHRPHALGKLNMGSVIERRVTYDDVYLQSYLNPSMIYGFNGIIDWNSIKQHDSDIVGITDDVPAAIVPAVSMRKISCGRDSTITWQLVNGPVCSVMMQKITSAYGITE